MTVKRVLGRHSVPYLITWGIRRVFRMLTRRMRILPDFIIIGSQRCGTTSLYNYLVEHPAVYPAFMKEVHFFDDHFGKGLNWYRAFFPLRGYRHYVHQVRRRDFVTGEATPYYIYYPHAAPRIRETVPGVKLIALLRNPIDRAYSHYHHEAKMGAETLSFEGAIERERKLLEREAVEMLDDQDHRSFAHYHYSYLSRGIYVNQLERWARCFDREQILVLKSEDFYAEPSATLGRVARFLGLANWELDSYKHHNLGRYPQMDLSTRERLAEFFEPHNQRLCAFWGVDFGWENQEDRKTNSGTKQLSSKAS